MKGLAVRKTELLGKRLLAAFLLAVAMAGVIALLVFGMPKLALAATDNAGSLGAGTIATQASATKASQFEYGVGRYVQNGKVYDEKCWYGTKTIDGAKYTRTKSKYGPEFTVSIIRSGSAGGGYGYDCGEGVYITGFKGSENAKVVVPDKIGGKPVVCVSLAGAKMKSLDVSKCNNLKALSVGFQSAGGSECTIGEIKFGKNPKLLHVNVDRSTVKSKLDITPTSIRVLHIMFSYLENGFHFELPKLQSFACYEFNNLTLGANKVIEKIYVPNCKGCKLKLSKMPKLVDLNVSNCALTKLNVSKNKKLKTIYAAGNNFDKKTIKALKKWQKAKKGRTLILKY